MKLRYIRMTAVLLLAVLIVSGCKNQTSVTRHNHSHNKEITVVTSIAPLSNIVGIITAGTNVKVHQIVPSNINAHTFSLSQKDIKALESSKLIILYSPELEFWAEPFIKSHKNILILNDSIKDFKPVYINKNKKIVNPHTWLDPIYTKYQAMEIEKNLSEIYPENKNKFSVNTAELCKNLDELNSYIKNLSEKSPEKLIISTHPSLVYFFQRYPSGESKYLQHGDDIDPSISEINSVISEIKNSKKEVLLISEKFINNKITDMIAKETNTKEILVNTSPDNYIDDMKSMADAIYK